jgi:HK97 family phage prohead protease
MKKKNFTFEVDVIRTNGAIKKGDWVILGYATTFDMKEDGIEITKAALENAKDDLLEYSTVLFNHNLDRPIGKIIETDVDDVGLLIKMVLSKEEEEIWKKVQDGTINKFSIQGRIVESEPIGEESTRVNKIKLYEAGLVSVPGDVKSKTISWWVARSLSNQTSNNFMEKFIKKLEKIQKKSTEDIKEDLNVIIEELKTKTDVISKLQLLMEKSKDEDKDALNYAITMLKNEQDKPEVEEEDEKEETFDLSDETEDRPVFQVNIDLTDEDTIEKKKGKNIFRKQILKKGKWYHWSAPGGVLEVTDKVISNIVENFKKGILDNVYVPLSHTTDPSKNVGEVLKLTKTKEGLDADIEIKDDTVAEKIKKGLIRCISASLDSNYYVTDKNKFVGPTILHAALVAEPFIKGMGNFIPLSDEQKDRNVILLEDSQPDFYSILNMIRESLESIKENSVTEKKLVELLKRENKEIKESTEGDSCETADGEKGYYEKDEEGNLVCIPKEEEEETSESMSDDEKEAKEKYEKCVSAEVKKGTDLGEAIQKCTKENQISEELSGDQPDEESEDEKEEAPEKVDLSDVEEVYERYLKEGKIVPAQKEAFTKLLASQKVVNLGDKEVDLSDLVKTFMESQPKIVNFEEEGTAGGTKPETKEKTIPNEVKDFYTKMGLSEDAIEESYQYAKKLKEDDEKEKESTIFN